MTWTISNCRSPSVEEQELTVSPRIRCHLHSPPSAYLGYYTQLQSISGFSMIVSVAARCFATSTVQRTVPPRFLSCASGSPPICLACQCEIDLQVAPPSDGANRSHRAQDRAPPVTSTCAGSRAAFCAPVRKWGPDGN